MSKLGVGKQELVMVAVLLSGAVLVVLNQTLLSPALPSIMRDLSVDATTVQWLTSGYSLVEAIIIPLSAFFIGRFSTRKLFIGGLLLFGVGSAVAAFSPNFGFLLLGRVLQATATGVVMPMVFTLIVLIFPRESRGQAMGIVGLVIAFAPAVGPSVSGVLVDTVGWRVLFLVVVTLAVVVILLAAFVLKNREGFERSNFDIPSVILSSLGMICLLYGFSTFASASNLAVTAVLICAGALFLGIFVKRQMSLEVPLLKVDVLKTRRYRTAVILVFILQCSLVGCGVILPIYLQNVLGHTATISGLIMLPGAALGALCGLLAGRLFDAHGIRKIALGGGAVMAITGIGMACFAIDTSLVFIALVYTVMVIGIQFLMTPLNTWGINSLDNRVVQHANAVSNTLNQVGASFGTAVIVSLSALGYLVAPNATGVEAVFAGQHISFIVMGLMMVVIFLLVVAMVKDKVTDVDPALMTDRYNGESRGKDKFWLVRDVMNTNAVNVLDTATVSEAIALMAKHDTSGLAVVDSANKVVGFLSEGDIMKGLAKEESRFSDGMSLVILVEDEEIQEKAALLLERCVMDIATKKPITVDANYSLQAAVKILSERRIKKMPVLLDGVLVGSLSRRDVIRMTVKVNKLD